jgi:hypothetical protein
MPENATRCPKCIATGSGWAIGGMFFVITAGLVGAATHNVIAAVLAGCGGLLVGRIVGHVVGMGAIPDDPEPASTTSTPPPQPATPTSPQPTPTNPTPLRDVIDNIIRVLLLVFLVVSLWDRVQLGIAAKKLDDAIKATQQGSR